jgi:acyl-CoA thioester hydrolase
MSPSTPAPAIDLRERSVFATWTIDTIRYRDLDPNGHVNNGAINMFFEDGRVHFRDVRMTALGDAILTGFAVARFTATYLAPLRYPGTVDIGTVVTRIGRSSFALGQGIFSGERCIATAEVVSVYFDPATGASVPLPDALRTVLEAAQPRGE